MDFKELIVGFCNKSRRFASQSTPDIGVKTRRVMIQIKDGLADEFSRFDSEGLETFAF